MTVDTEMPADDAHQQRTEDVVGAGDEAADEPADRPRHHRSRQGLATCCFEEHAIRLGRGGLAVDEFDFDQAEISFSSSTAVIGNWTDRPARLNGSVRSITIVDGPRHTTWPV